MAKAKTRFLNQAGDTIVEVLLAVVVVGLAIGMGYGIASRSLRSNRQAQERVEALKKVESQVERLKKLASTDDGGEGGVFRSSAYCIIDIEGGAKNQPINIATPPALNADLLGDAYNQIGGTNSCRDGLYHLSIKLDETLGNTKQFNVTARWFGLGADKQETTITYRVYPAI